MQYLGIHFYRNESSVKSHLIRLVATIAGRTTDGITHVAFSTSNGIKFALLGNGIQTIPPAEDVRIVRSYTVAIDDDNDSWFERVFEYMLEGYNVSLWSLFKVLLYPERTHFALCTSFVSYVVFGKIDKTCNSLLEFEKYVSNNAV